MKAFYDESEHILVILVVITLLFLIAVLTLITLSQRLTALERDLNSLPIEIRLEQPEFLLKSPKDGLMEALEYYNIPHAEIVYAQAYLETGNFKSNICINNNNIFGLYNSSQKRYMIFDHWVGSVITYKKCISDKYIDTTENYYQFLNRISYAEANDYNETIEKIRKQLFE